MFVPGVKLYSSCGAYEVKCDIDRGAFGLVLNCVTNCHHSVALKVQQTPPSSEKDHYKRVRAEISALRRANGLPFVIRTLDVFNYEFAGKLWTCIATPIYKHNLQMAIESGRLRTDVAAAQLLCAVAGIHSRGVLHRDIKPQNIMLDRHDKLVLIDLGLSTEQAPAMTPYVVTRWYRAPEFLLSNGGYAYTDASDAWSVGVVVHEMVTCAPTFPGDSAIFNIPPFTKTDDLLAVGHRAHAPPSHDLRAHEIAAQLMQPNPNHRAALAPLLEQCTRAGLLERSCVLPQENAQKDATVASRT
jgi:serine/threonine protein kinase